MKTGFIGLGAMGMGMARNVAKAGLLAAVYNRTVDKAEQLANELDIDVCATPEQLAAQVDVVLICVSADADVLEMVSAVAKTIRPGSVVVDLSTVSVGTAVEAAQRLAEKRADFLDAPVSGGVEGANKGTLAIMVGGEQRVLERAKPVLESMGSRLIYMGPTGFGQATKAVNQIMAAGINQAVTEALAFGQAQGLPMDKVVEVISGGAAGNWFLQHRGPTMTKNVFEPGFKVALHHKDLQICRCMAEQIGVDKTIVEMTLGDYKKLMEEGHGDEDISALYRLKRKK